MDFDIVAVHVTPKADPYGQVRGGCIRISTYSFGKGSISIDRKAEVFDSGQGGYFRTSGVPDSVRDYLNYWLDVRDLRELSDLSNVYYCFCKYGGAGDSCMGLFMEKIGAGKFKRIGYFDSSGTNFPFRRLDIDDYEYLDEAGRYTFSIV